MFKHHSATVLSMLDASDETYQYTANDGGIRQSGKQESATAKITQITNRVGAAPHTCRPLITVH